MKIAIDTLGCKLNQAESEKLASRFAEAGHTLVGTVEEADIYILNTCTVTDAADAKSRHLLRQARRRNPEVMLVATGCFPERAPEALSRIDGVKLVTGNAHKLDLPEILAESGLLAAPEVTPPAAADSLKVISRTRAFIKIQDGCSGFCSYCIVPFVRGRETNLPAGQVIGEIRKRVSAGVKEAVLTGTEPGSYNDGGTDLAGLLRRVLVETEIPRIRLSSLQPDEITPGLINLWQDSRLCPHFHISLQSGSDSVLKRMNRRYSTEEYRSAVALLKSRVPGAAVTTDIIAGFPGETEEEYRESLEICRKSGFARIHVFPFSKRPGTTAANMPDQVPDSIRKHRSQKLRILGRECAESFRQGFTGSVLDVLWEQRSRGDWSGYTGNYIRVYTGSSDNLANRITPVKLAKPYRDGMWGEIL